ncbi:hypothetical protein CRE_19769 [Caenorhabditis remanei]|uniref:BTB domain-containing protein n=1 Tax=Caenorhabditis remanei TaxID=31234 RepID=E3MTP8_CAERE|nr:hypothetical protein CRE_19769 [Caenorhabditis remanei]
MSATPEISIYESTFAKSDKTDAILVVRGKKLHVNKGVLSYHSEYFDDLFNGEFKEKSMQEIPINDVKFEDFAATLSLLQHNPIKPTGENAERLLTIADRFLLPVVKPSVELVLITSDKDKLEKIRIADEFKLYDLLNHAAMLYTSYNQFNGFKKTWAYRRLSDNTKAFLFNRLLTILGCDK